MAPVEIRIGEQLRRQRNILGLSQEDLADVVGLKYEKIQNYECGEDRISSGTLFLFAKALSVPIIYFFGDTTFVANISTNEKGGAVPNNEGMLLSNESSEMMNAYDRIYNPRIRKCIAELIKSVAVSGEKVTIT